MGRGTQARGLRESDFASVRRSLLPEGSVSISEGEIKFRHPKAPKPLIYKCDQFLDEGLLLRGTRAKGRKCVALYDMRWADEIYLLREAGGVLIPCHLRDTNSIHVNRDWAETVQYLGEMQARRDLQASTVLQAEVNFNHRMQERVSKARRQVKEARENNPAQSKSAILRGIRSNRKAETERMHEQEANQLRSGDSQVPAKLAHENHSQIAHNDSRYSVGPQIPDIAELRKKRMGR